MSNHQFSARDAFAAVALHAMMTADLAGNENWPLGIDLSIDSEESNVLSDTVKAAFYIADRMMEQREK